MATAWPLRPALQHASRAAVSSKCNCQSGRWLTQRRRQMHLDHRDRLSNVWVPAPQVLLKDAKEDEESHAKLVRAGFFRQAYSGVFHMLPLGLRVQEKIEALVDRHMKAIGASRVSLSSISSARLWSRSGRLESVEPELFQFSDRKGAKYLLSPTHEEEITELVAQNVHSYRGLPLRLYQITRKYRDEMRPRHGILRSREFIMKDLYSFDASVEAALATYEQVRGAYARIFAELKVPVLVARASSGDMGGDLSHEYHLAASLGEDYVARCSQCGYTANTEVMQAQGPPKGSSAPPLTVRRVQAWRGISKDRKVLVTVWYPGEAVHTVTGAEMAMSDEDIDAHAVKVAVPELDASVENPAELWNEVLAKATAIAESAQASEKPRLVNLIDWRLQGVAISTEVSQEEQEGPRVDPLSWPAYDNELSPPTPADGRLFTVSTAAADHDGQPFNFAKVRTGDDCTSCGGHGTLTVERAIELGHTFYLGTRYTSPSSLDVKIQAAEAASSLSSSSSSSSTLVPLMGCYGIGISRILGAVADHKACAQGLNWPRVIAPYEVVVVAATKHDDMAAAAEAVYDGLAGGRVAGTAEQQQQQEEPQLDVLLDDRVNASLPYKLKDADLTGYPVVVVVGAAWRKSVGGSSGAGSLQDGLCEVQCRQLGVRQDVPLRDLRRFVSDLLTQL